MAHPILVLQVDAFTAQPFRGNPAGVCLLAEAAEVPWMQAVAAEMNLSETAFVLRRDRNFSIRWFTPTTEVPLCGHATLASAHVLWSERLVAQDAPIRFESASGPLGAKPESGWICLDFPASPVEPYEPPPALAEALGCRPVSVHRDRRDSYLVELDTVQRVQALRPDVRLLQKLGAGSCIVTARSDSAACDFVSRYFAPRYGIDEDPVTGSAHCCLAPFWCDRLGRAELIGHQVSKRGGVVRVRVRSDRVELVGQAVTVIRGTMLV